MAGLPLGLTSVSPGPEVSSPSIARRENSESLMYHWQICPSFQWAPIPLRSWLLLLCKSYFVWCGPICLLLSVSLAWGDRAAKILLGEVSEILLPLFPSRIFMVSRLTFKSSIHVEFSSCVWCKLVVWFLFLHVSICPIFPAPFVDDCTMRCAHNVLLSCTLQTCMVFQIITPVNSIKNNKNHKIQGKLDKDRRKEQR